MKALLICPAEREAVGALAEAAPLSNLPLFGKSLVEYWLEDLAARGANQILLSASDRAEQVSALLGDGARWGVRVAVLPELHELTPEMARAKYHDGGEWSPADAEAAGVAGSARDAGAAATQAPGDVTVMEHLPGQPEFPLFTGYGAWFAAALNWLPRAAATPDRIGVREIKPGVWIGLRTHIARDAQLRPPCWIGDYVFVGSGTVIGPMAVLENRCFVEPGAEIASSIVGADTFVGESTEIHESLAFGNTLVNWRAESCVKVPDTWLLCSLNPSRSPGERSTWPSLVAPRHSHWSWKFSVKMES